MEKNKKVYKKYNKFDVVYEPWHYRYVGMEAAEKIFNNQICLEEYFGRE